jgi:glutamyl-tRNA synthetase/glutamyl-Q tRNA(Asp) synthetase
VIVTRFAPAPTGPLHVGHVLNAIYVWGIARGAGGRVLLRIEDHDRQRSRPEFERGILDDLEWLGFLPDSPGLAAFGAGRCDGRQSTHGDRYDEALAILRGQELLYACDCSRRAIANAGVAALEGEETRYPGTCASKSLPEQPERGVRVRLAPAVERFDDIRHGAMSQQPSEQCGDLLVRDRDGNWTYQFAVTVDDWREGVNLVVRGDDLLASTGRQIQLARLLGRDRPPRFLHHPLIMKAPGRKLSKSDGDTGVRDLRAGGLTPAQVIGYAAWLGGLAGAPDSCSASQVHQLGPLQAIAAAIASPTATVPSV